jgi:hypothetical protein
MIWKADFADLWGNVKNLLYKKLESWQNIKIKTEKIYSHGRKYLKCGGRYKFENSRNLDTPKQIF